MPGQAMLLGQLGLDLSVYAAGMVFLLPLRRRGRFPLRLGLCLAGGALLSAGYSLLRALAPWTPPGLAAALDALWMLLLFAVLMAQARFCVRGAPSAGAYCAAWALVAQQLAHESWLTLSALLGLSGHWWYAVVWFALVYVCLGLTVARWMPDHGVYDVGPRQLSLALLMTLISSVLYLLYCHLAPGVSVTGTIIILSQLYCATVFYLQSVLFQRSAMRQELMTLSLLWQQSKAKYSLAKENIDLINRKCHDLKHQMRALHHMEESEARAQYVSELEHSIQIYDAIVKTGNEALDTILTEKSLYCEANHILVSCVADGSRLEFINPIDLYAIFGNAMDNAIESVQRIDDSGRRIIDVQVYVKRQFLSISITNPIGGGALTFEDGLPVTTKEKNGYHGFGLKSIRHTAQKYGGFVTAEATEGCFSLRILFPLPA